jgi:hypothetical protein
MFTPAACFKGAALVWVVAGMRFHSATAGLWFAAVPFGFGVAAAAGGLRDRFLSSWGRR